jgi:hypothetical protein
MRCLGTSFRSFSIAACLFRAARGRRAATRNAAYVFNAAQGDEKKPHTAFAWLNNESRNLLQLQKIYFVTKKLSRDQPVDRAPPVASDQLRIALILGQEKSMEQHRQRRFLDLGHHPKAPQYFLRLRDGPPFSCRHFIQPGTAVSIWGH